MALLKTIELESGIVLGYHRIVSITKITNCATVLEIASYANKEKREQEREQLKNMETVTPYIDSTFVGVDYDEASTIKDWYAYLKTTEKYKGAEDDEDEEDQNNSIIVEECERIEE